MYTYMYINIYIYTYSRSFAHIYYIYIYVLSKFVDIIFIEGAITEKALKYALFKKCFEYFPKILKKFLLF